MLILARWFTYVLIGCVVSHLAERSRVQQVWALVLSLSSVEPLLLCLGLFLTFLFHFRRRRSVLLRFWHWRISLLFFATTVSCLLRSEVNDFDIALLVALITIITMQRLPSVTAVNAIRLLTTLLVLGVLFSPGTKLFPRLEFKTFQQLTQYASPDMLSIARIARRNTPTTAHIVVPPDFKEFPTHSFRATFVTFKSFPLVDNGMVEWFERLDALGAPLVATGFKNASLANRRYTSITDSTLLKLKRSYGVTHAVLFSATPTFLPIIGQNSSFKLVAIE